MINTHSHLRAFHDDEVTLKEEMKDIMRKRRQANQERLANGLAADDKPTPRRHVKQGSYAMYTMVQSEVDSSDIDDGVVFGAADLKGPRGAEYTPIEAKQMVCDALKKDESKFKQSPEVRRNCVRVYYADGFTIDIPVYREVGTEPDTTYERASSDWLESDPEGVTEWFNRQVINKSPDETNGRQMRRLVRLLKAWSRSRTSWNMPSGFILSILVDEVYPAKDPSYLNRDDYALVAVLERLHNRLQTSRIVRHPVVNENVTRSDADADMVELRDRVGEAVKAFAPLRRTDCSERDALMLWRDFFATDYFDTKIAELGEKMAAAAAGISSSSDRAPEEVIKRGGEGKYA